jgi:hypothetical protein
VEVWREEGRVCAYGYSAEGSDWLQLPAIATFRLGDEVVAYSDPSALPDMVRDAYERSVLPIALHLLGGEALHASAVRGPAGVVALCGESGTGKSTLAAALGHRGHPVWADDAVAFELVDSRVVAIPLPFRTSLRPPAAAELAHSEPDADRRPEPLVAAVVLERAPGSLAVRRLSGGEALSRALQHAYSFRPDDSGPGERTAVAYLELVARVPVVEVRFEARWEELDSLVDAVERIVVG